MPSRADVLDDHVDVDARFSKRPEDRGGDARPVRHLEQRDLGLVARIGDAADDLLFHDFLLAADERAGRIFQTGQHLQPHPVLHRELDRARLKHLGAERGELKHLLVRDLVDLPRAPLDPRVRGVDAVHVGVDVAALGLERRGEGHGRGVRAAAAERRDAPVGAEPLEARDDGVQAFGELLVEIGRVDLKDTRGAVRARGADRHLPSLPGPRRNAHLLQGERHQARVHLLAAGDDGVVFAGVVETPTVRPRWRGRLAHPGDELVGGAGHRRDDNGDVVAALDLALDLGRRIADALEVGERGPAEFHDQARHALPSEARDLAPALDGAPHIVPVARPQGKQ